MDDNKRTRQSDTLQFNQGRLGTPPTELFQQIVNRPGVMMLRDPDRFSAEIIIDLAHTVMLAEQGIIEKKHAAVICDTLLKAMNGGPESIPLDFSKDGTLFQIESYLGREIGPDIAGRMHTARSRTDRDATIMRFHLRGHLLQVIEALLGWQETLLGKGEEYYDAVMPGYTHLQPAQPITLGHHLMAQFWLHVDDLERLQLAYDHTDVNCLGTASIAGTSWPIDRDRTRELLGFQSNTENARVSRTYIYRAEVANVYSMLMTTLHYLASDFYVWSSHEFRMVEPADEHSGSSSIMPQKKNAYVWEHTRVAARHASGWPGSALASLMGASSSDSFLEAPNIEHYGPIVEGLLKINAETLGRLKVDRERMLQLVNEDFSSANDLADVLVRRRGLSFHDAHEIVARLVRLAVQNQRSPSEIDSRLLDEAAQEVGIAPPRLDGDTFMESMDPVRFVRSRITPGSTNPKDVLRQIEKGRQELRSHRVWLHDTRRRVEKANSKLMDAVDHLKDE